MLTTTSPWDRAIILVDMNAFFASIEQRDFPALRGKPVGVTNGEQGTCIITCSYEARDRGVKTGMRLYEARQLCPGLIQRPARPQRYAQVSTQLMAALRDQISPQIEVFSVDEAFLDVTHCQRLLGTPAQIGQRAKQAVDAVSGLPCSIGVSGDKTTAKYAAKLQKPNGLTVIPPWEAKRYLHNVPVTELCGIAGGIGRFLAARGVYTCGDMVRLPIGVLAKRFGDVGRRIWYMCQGEDPEPLRCEATAPKTLGHGKVLPPNTYHPRTLSTYLLHMSEKVAARLRRHQLHAREFFIGLHTRDDWIGGPMATALPTNDGRVIFALCRALLRQCWQGEGVYQVQITALDPRPVQGQLELFDHVDTRRQASNQVMDCINDRYGEFTLAPARLLNRSSTPNVIAPVWKPSGHRQTV
ncbi:MAG: DNA polymerase IV [Gammaproteobacteria bacterium]|nr:DNA polymerase IV [Gammaproteobacteria bacterium]